MVVNKDYYSGVLQSRREMVLNPKYNMEKWKFIAKEHGGVACWIEISESIILC